MIPGARNADCIRVPEEQRISHIPQWHEKSASEFQRIIFNDLWYESAAIKITAEIWRMKQQQALDLRRQIKEAQHKACLTALLKGEPKNV